MESSNELKGIGAVLKENRMQCGLSVETLCEKTGIIPSRLTDFEAGTALPSLEQMQKLADVFHKSLSALFSETDEKRPKPEPAPEEKTKIRTCRYAFPMLNRTHRCRNEERTCNGKNKTITEPDCEACPYYDSRYIQYPLTINGLDIEPMEAWDLHSIGDLVAVRPCSDNPDGKTYLGLYLGEQPWFLSASYQRTDKCLHVRSACNPMIYIFAAKTIVRGANSWWTRIKSEADMKDITDDAINNTWYVQMLKSQIDKAAEE